MNKLIRDKIPQMVLDKERRTMPIRIADEAEYLTLLKQKLVEEANEVLTASPASLLEELADVLEVFAALCKAHGMDDSVFEARKKKFDERGGFDSRIVLELPDA
jgi:predicted house-cleaning noncanonical NTP pyrophosphatase (MazG superfamily)